MAKKKITIDSKKVVSVDNISKVKSVYSASYPTTSSTIAALKDIKTTIAVTPTTDSEETLQVEMSTTLAASVGLEGLYERLSDAAITSETLQFNAGARLDDDYVSNIHDSLFYLGIKPAKYETLDVSEVFQTVTQFIRKFDEGPYFEEDYLLAPTDYFSRQMLLQEVFSIDFDKGVLLEDLEVNTVFEISYTKPFSEDLNTGDSFSRIVDFNRIYTEQLDATDDVLGEANIDDDQTVLFNKILSETPTQASDTNTIYKDIDKPFTEEAKEVTDTNDILFNKLKLESLATSNIITKDISRPAESSAYFLEDYLVDNGDYLVYGASAYDYFSAGFGKPVTEPTIVSSETFSRIIAFNRTFEEPLEATDDVLGEANIDDDQYVVFGKTLPSDSVSASELQYSNIQPYIDEQDVNTSESGSTNLQDYFLADFVKPGFIGTNTTF